MANSVASAFRILALSPIDIVCLDINLGKENSFPIADELTARGIRFVLVSAHDSSVLPAAHQERPFGPTRLATADLGQVEVSIAGSSLSSAGPIPRAADHTSGRCFWTTKLTMADCTMSDVRAQA
jgi:hypothetical protein